MTLQEKSYQAAEMLVSILVKNAPKETWNLALNGIRIMQDSANYYVLIGGEVAPYAIYTNEPEYHKKCAGWIDKSIEEAQPYIKLIMSGDITEEDYFKTIDNQKEIIREQFNNHIRKKLEELNRI
jgi:hypothetical protein